jgi:hypothetical protein
VMRVFLSEKLYKNLKHVGARRTGRETYDCSSRARLGRALD